MPRVKLRGSWAVVALVLALMAGIGWWAGPRPSRAEEPIGLFTTLPILWDENADIAAALNPDAKPHWARGVLARAGAIAPLDLLATPEGPAPLAAFGRLVMAQPRVLSPQENVALDDWVRSGGRLLLLADPALTEDSLFPLGDPRRPQAVVMLSPILERWGLELRFDEHQPAEEVEQSVMGMALPVNLPGHFATQGQANCRLWEDGLAVTCAIGKGRVMAVADAAVLERADPDTARARAFAGLLDSAFAAR